MLVSGLLIVSCLTLGVFCHDFVLSCDPLCVTGNLCGFQLFLRFVCWKISVFPKVPTVWDLMTWTSTGVNGREHWSDWQSLETRCVTQWIEKWALGSTDVTLQLRHWSDSQCFETRRVSLWVMSLNCCANLPPRLDYNCKQVFTVEPTLIFESNACDRWDHSSWDSKTRRVPLSKNTKLTLMSSLEL